jgi:hypothetical protein
MSTRTNIILDDDLVAQAMARAGVTTKKAAVEAALRAYVRKPDYAKVLALEGSRLIADDYDPKALFTQGWGLSVQEQPAVKPYKPAVAPRKRAKKSA